MFLIILKSYDIILFEFLIVNLKAISTAIYMQDCIKTTSQSALKVFYASLAHIRFEAKRERERSTLFTFLPVLHLRAVVFASHHHHHHHFYFSLTLSRMLHASVSHGKSIDNQRHHAYTQHKNWIQNFKFLFCLF